MNRKRHVKPGLARAWQLKKGTPEYITAATIWGNLNIKPAEKAISMFPDSELREASKSAITNIFGSREECLEWLKNLNS